MSKPISILANHRMAIEVKVVGASGTQPVRLRVKLGRKTKFYHLPALISDHKQAAVVIVKQFIQDHQATFSENDTTFVLSSTCEGFVAVLINAETTHMMDKL